MDFNQIVRKGNCTKPRRNNKMHRGFRGVYSPDNLVKLKKANYLKG